MNNHSFNSLFDEQKKRYNDELNQLLKIGKSSSAINEFLMGCAIDLSSLALDNEGAPFGAIIFDEKCNEIIGVGFNIVEKTHDIVAHGEVVAFRHAGQSALRSNFSDCLIFTSCEPCAMCASCIWLSKVAKVFYGNALVDTQNLFNLKTQFQDCAQLATNRSIPYEQLQAEKAEKVIRTWASAYPDAALLNAMNS